MELWVLWGGHPRGPPPVDRATHKFPLIPGWAWEGRAGTGWPLSKSPRPAPRLCGSSPRSGEGFQIRV